MPDAHVGYGLPIGGVLALENAVCPYAVGVDIACRMKLSVFAIDHQRLDTDKRGFIEALNRRTFFGVGVENNASYDHPVLYHGAWEYIDVLRDNMNSFKAVRQLGTSGSGNHFVEFGVLEVPYNLEGVEPGIYVALMSHSGSRCTGAAVCKTYSNIAHNFAWKEIHDGRELVVHRKGATPAGDGVLGVIPGSMGTPAYVVRGKGNPDSLNSASHGAGRVMSRKQANKTFNYREEIDKLAARGITVLSAGAH